jgi:putative hemolysin
LIQRSRATVVPIWFGGQNGRLFQIASHVSQTLRLSLIFHEVKARIGTLLPVAIGAPIPFEALRGLNDRQALADELRARTYAMTIGATVGPMKPNPAQNLIGKLRALRPKKRAA